MMQDLRYALRVLRKSPGVTILAIAALALGIGANAAIFSVVNGVLLRPLPYKDPERLVFLRVDLPGQAAHSGIADAEIRDIRQRSRLVEQIGWMVQPNASLTDGEMEHVTAATASDYFLPTLGIQPLLGRNLNGKEDIGSVHVEHLLISYDLWERRYNKDPDIIGKPIEVNNFSATIVGVLPRGFRVYMGADTNVPPRIDIWFPGEHPESYGNRRYHGQHTVARLRKGVTLDQAQAELDALSRQMVEQHPKDYPDGNFRIRLTPLHQDLVKPVRSAILVLLAAVGFVLLIACANIANLLLARAAGRKKEIAVRAALGAGRLRVVRQLLIESLLLAGGGGTLGLVLAHEGVNLLMYLRPNNLPRQDDIVLDATVTVFTLAISVASGILFGIVPAFHAAKADINATLNETGRALTSGAATHRVRTFLVVTQVALSLVLLIGSGLMIRTFANMRRVDLGFGPANVLTFRFHPSPWEFRDDQLWLFYKRVVEALKSQPGVEAVSGVCTVPLDPLVLPGYYAFSENPEKRLNAVFNPVLPGFFGVMRIPITAGRDFTDEDNTQAAAVAMVDERFAAKTWPGENPVGKRIVLWPEAKTGSELTEIIGVVKHVQFSGFHDEERTLVYVPYRNYLTYMTMTVRSAGDNAMALATPLRKVVDSLGGHRPVFDIRLMNDYVDGAMAETRFALVLLGVMSVVAFALSMIGIFGVVSYVVSERLQEFAIRLALGAQARDILRLAFGFGLAPTLVGVLIGIGGALALTRFLSTLLFGVAATDVSTYAVISSVLLAASALACYIPVRWRALRVNPKAYL